MADQTTKTIIVGAGIDTAYDAWANFENFPRFMKDVKSVTKTGDRMSHWVVKGPLGKDVEWDAETTRLEKNKRIAWNSKETSDIKTSGQVTFNDLGKGQTEITVTLQWVVPASMGGEKLAGLVADPGKRLEEDLLSFKHYVEQGVSTSAAR
jgi:uncharacterized membrane protein